MAAKNLPRWCKAFKRHLERRQLTQVITAKQLRRSQSCISQYCNGYIPRRLDLMRIERWSGGDVPASLAVEA